MPKTKFLKREIDQLKSFTKEENLRIISHINNIKKKDCCCILDCPKTDLLIFYWQPISRYINTTIFLNIERCVGSFILFWTWILSRILYNLKRFSYFSFSSHCIFLSSIFFFRSFLIKFSLGHLYTILSVRDTERDHA